MGIEVTTVRREQEADGGPGGMDVPRCEDGDQVCDGPAGLGQASEHGVLPPDVIAYPPVQLEVQGDDQRSGPVGHAHRRIHSLTVSLLVRSRPHAHRTPWRHRRRR